MLHSLPQAKLTADTQYTNINLQHMPSASANTSGAGNLNAHSNPATLPHVMIAGMVWDKFNVQVQPGAHRGDVNIQVPLKQDLLYSDLLEPKCHATVSESMLQQHREYNAQRARCDTVFPVLSVPNLRDLCVTALPWA